MSWKSENPALLSSYLGSPEKRLALSFVPSRLQLAPHRRPEGGERAGRVLWPPKSENSSLGFQNRRPRCETSASSCLRRIQNRWRAPKQVFLSQRPIPSSGKKSCLLRGPCTGARGPPPPPSISTRSVSRSVDCGLPLIPLGDPKLATSHQASPSPRASAPAAEAFPASDGLLAWKTPAAPLLPLLGAAAVQSPCTQLGASLTRSSRLL